MELRAALIGAGNVTRAFLQYWRSHPNGIDLRIVSVVRRRGAWNGNTTPEVDLERLDYRESADPFNGARLVIEALPSCYPDGEPATSFLRSALAAGMDVLTVDKGPLVAALHELQVLAAANNTRLRFCVGGALPAVDVALRDLRGCTVRSIRAILNGTSNFVLDEMRNRGCTMDEAVRVAIDRGIAEPDPSQDLDGIDTAAKMVILVNASLGLDIKMNDVDLHGIRSVKPSEGIWKLVGTFAEGRIRVQPELVSGTDRFAQVNGTDKIVEFDTIEMGRLSVIGGASGRIPMGATMTKEILNLYAPLP